MNIDFIKWLCEKADGFNYISPHVGGVEIAITFDGAWVREDSAIFRCMKALLLQRAIEGVSREAKELCIVQKPHCINVEEHYCMRQAILESFDVSDQAKESALMYIWEQENKP